MRKVILGVMFAMAALPAAAGVPMGSSAGASPVSTQPLAADEILLEISALGTATSRAEMATLTGTLSSRGATETEARRVHDANIRRLRSITRRAGVAAADLVIGEAEAIAEAPVTDMNMDMSSEDAAASAAVEAAVAAGEAAASESADANTEAAADAMSQAHFCNASCPGYVEEIVLTSSVEIRLRNLDNADELNQALQEVGTDLYTAAPVYVPGDQSAARRTARAQALAAARADAEAYAATLGLRVVRIVRVTERMGMDLMSLAMSESSPMRNIFQQMEQAQGPDIPTMVAVGVDFALGPQ